MKSMFKWIIKVLMFLAVGYVLTDKVLRLLYENYGIRFIGNVWINWFGVSFLLFVAYSIFRGVFVNFLKFTFISIVFWLLFIGALIAVLLPFITGNNPF